MHRKNFQVIYPILFAFYFFLHFYAVNISAVLFPFQTILTYLGITVLGISTIWFGLYMLWNDVAQSGIFVAALVILFFTYGHIYDALYFRENPTNIYVHSTDVLLRSYLTILFVWALFAVAAFMVTIARGKQAHRLTTALNAMGIVMCAFPVTTIMLNRAPSITFLEQNTNSEVQPISLSTTATGYGEQLPDIYYIILDAYARADILKEHYGYDNTFVDYLQSKDFYVAADSTTNYTTTILSLSSTLNMRYLVIPNDIRNGDFTLQSLIKDNVLCRSLREIGYTYIVMESIITGVTDCGDMRIANEVNNLDVIFLKTTLIRPFLNQAVWGKPTYDNHLQRLDALLAIPQMAEPTFIFAHFILPHEPFVFDRDGNQIFIDITGSGAEFNAAYLDQLIYTNVLFESAINQILNKSEVPPIIIIQGDHGPPWNGIQTLTDEFFAIRLPILNAYHLPNGGNEALYPSISPVNTFRVLLNYYFDGQLDTLPDESYIFHESESWFEEIVLP